MKFIGIDIGTTSICGVALDARNRRLASVTRPNNSWITSRHKWGRIQDPAKISRTVDIVLSELLSKHPGVRGIGVTGQMHGIVYIDSEGRAVSPLYTWQDARGNQVYRSKKTYAEALSSITGYKLAAGFGMVTHWYNHLNSQLPLNARKFCTIHDYIVMRLSGGKAPVTDPTDAASLGIFDLRRNLFDGNALKKAGIRYDSLPEVVPSGTMTGRYRGIPVYAALGDNQASFLGSVRNIENTLLLNIGTGGQISGFTRKFPVVDGLDVRPFPGGGYIMVGALLCGGKAYALLEDFFRKTAAFFSLPAGRKDFYDRMNAVQYSAVVEKLSVDTRFAGTRLNPNLRGSIGGISMDNFTPEHLVAGFLNGIAWELYDFYSVMPVQVRRNIRNIAGSGNGIRRNSLLCRVLSGRFNRKLSIPSHCEEASVGAALTAAVGGGFFKEFSSAGRVIQYRQE